ncbi:hypothetical protein R1flu_020126 [Riccia fluitans]|uniref:Putative gamma-glutamylcyclotransferase n=1 Tax=Riccia fluitans TaxID=41844 RepID=A0ABD1ZKN2_9MARC
MKTLISLGKLQSRGVFVMYGNCDSCSTLTQEGRPPTSFWFNIRLHASRSSLLVFSNSCWRRPGSTKLKRMAAGAAAAVRNVFVYGSLLAPEVMQAVIHRVPPSAPAIVSDFHRYGVRGQLYPAVTPKVGDKVTGRVVFGLTQQELALLDDYEDTDYTREVVQPTLLDKVPDQVDILLDVPLQAYLYVWTRTDDINLYGDWNYEDWRKNHLAEYLSRYFG